MHAKKEVVNGYYVHFTIMCCKVFIIEVNIRSTNDFQLRKKAFK